MIIASGAYVGTGAAQSVTAIGFTPKIVIIKGPLTIAVIATDTMSADNVKPLTGLTALVTGCITSLDVAGFTLGTDARTNTNGTTYYWLALGDDGSTDLETGSYVGNLSDNRNISLSILSGTPDMVWAMAATTIGQVIFRTSTFIGDTSQNFASNLVQANRIQSFSSGSFQIGSDVTINDSAGSPTYHWFALKNATNLFKVFSYLGDGSDNRSITGAGFPPDTAFTKRSTSSNTLTVRFKGEVGDASFQVDAGAEVPNFIQALEVDGFQVGSNAAVNITGSPQYNAFVFKDSAPAPTGPQVFYMSNVS